MRTALPTATTIPSDKRTRNFWIVLGTAGSLRLGWVSLFRSGSVDLHVYWKGVQLWLSGVSPYLYTGTEGAIVFKYPPWILPFFLPLALFNYEIWQWLWVPIQLLAIFYCIRWVLRAGVSFNIACLTAGLFWWIWLGHAMAGQCTLLILVVALWAVPPEKNRSIRPGPASLMTLLLSSKVFNLVSLLGLTKDLLKPRPILITLSALLFLEALVMSVFHFHGSPLTFIELHRQWLAAGTSAGKIFSVETIRGNGNHGLTALVLRLMHVPAEDSSKDIGVAAILGCILSTAWYLVSKKLSRAEKWAGWIAVGTIIHPLLWHHSFVLCFPVCALAFERAMVSKKPHLIFSALLAIFLIGILIPNVFGVDFVRPFELMGSKSWGVVIACAVLALAPRTSGG